MQSLLDIKSLIPYDYCLPWSPLSWLHVPPNVLLTLGYYAVPLIFLYVIRQRKHLPYSGSLILAAGFAGAYEATDLLSAITLSWQDDWRKALAALIAFSTAAQMFWLIPRALSLPSAARLRSEIQQRKSAEEALRQSEIKFYTLYDLHDDAVMLLNEQGFFDCNKAALSLFAYRTREEFCTKHFADLSPQQQPCGACSLTLFNQKIAAALENDCHRFEWLYQRNGTGVTFPAEVALHTIQLNEQRVYQVVVRDITARKKEEEAAQAAAHYARNLIEASLDPLLTINTEGKITDVNLATELVTGVSREQLIGSDFISYFTDPETARNLLVFSQGYVTDYKLAMRHVSGKITDVLYNASVYHDDNGNVLGILAAARDITALKKLEDETRLAATIFESQQGMLVADANQISLRINRAFTDITGYSTEDVIGKSAADILKSDRHNAAFYSAMQEQIDNTGRWDGEIWHCRKNGEIYPEYLTITAVKNQSGQITNYVTTFDDITVRKEAADQIERLAFYDPLTNLPNRRLLQDRLTVALASSHRNGQKGALLFIDLDNFKILNDTLGHDMGDLLLERVAQRLVFIVRETDTIARLGGDEFMIMLEDLDDDALKSTAMTGGVGNKILATLNQPYHLGAHIYHSTPSIGATLFNGHDHPAEEIIKQADIAMYQAKNSGRNALCFFDSEMQKSLNARASMEADLRLALMKNQFELYYQPQVSHNQEVIGAEALIRWRHPQRGLVSPAEFIPLAEQTGLILPIGQWVLETACAQLKIWKSSINTEHLQLAVNVSAKQFHLPDFVEQVSRVIISNDLNPYRLKLELTETMVLDNVDDTLIKMKALKKIGVRFSMDDFGTGHSSLSILKKLPFDQLKIDQSFVRDISIDQDDEIIVKTIIQMAINLGMEVIAEGVETPAQYAFLKLNNCLAYQGYLFSKPVSIEQFDELQLVTATAC